MSHPKIGNKAPDFTLAATGDQQIKLSGLRGAPVVLYCYPKDATPGCTQEGLDFTAAIAEFNQLKVTILGLSRDSVASHEKFKLKQAFAFDLLSDSEEKACHLYDVIKEKNMYGKKVMGIERSTFLIDADGALVQEWRKVKVKDHVQEVLEAVKQLA
jgi:peroxiredoxin Q/BCP